MNDPRPVCGASRVARRRRASPAPTARPSGRGPVLLLLLAAVAALPARAGEPAAFSLDEAVAIARRDNAELNGLRARAGALRERPGQAEALPDPMLTYGAMDAVSGGRWPDTGEKRLMIEQAYPGPGKRALRRGIAGQEAAASQFELEALTRDLVTRVKEAYFDLRATRRALAISREEQQLVRRLITTAETLYATGERPQADVLRGQTELTLLKQKRLDLMTQESVLQARLNALLNRPAETAVGETVTAPDLAAAEAAAAPGTRAPAERPEIRAARAQLERLRLEQALMAREGTPDYRLGAEYRTFADSADMAMVTVSVDLPVRRSRIAAGIREAAHMSRYGEAALEAAERQAVLETQEAALRLQAARRTLELTESELIPQAGTRLAASEAAYRAGKGDFSDLLESERVLLNARAQAAEAEGTVGVQAARLERALGEATPADDDRKGALP